MKQDLACWLLIVFGCGMALLSLDFPDFERVGFGGVVMSLSAVAQLLVWRFIFRKGTDG